MDPGGDPDMTWGTVGATGLFTAQLTSCPTLLAIPGAWEKFNASLHDMTHKRMVLRTFDDSQNPGHL